MTSDATEFTRGLVSVFEDRPEGRKVHVQIDSTGLITGFSGHVDLGTGIETALAQIVAEELDADLAQVRIVLGNTAETPDQGPTIASETIQITAKPLRQAAAQLRHFLAGQGARQLNAPIAELTAVNSHIVWQQTQLPYGALVAGLDVSMRLEPESAVKDPASYSVVGQPVARRDLPDKAQGRFRYIQDVSIDGMLHGHVIRPPYHGRDSGAFIGCSLISWDEAAISQAPGFVAVVRQGDFLGVVATTAAQARSLAEALPVNWRHPPATPDLSDLEHGLKSAPSTPRLLDDLGDFDAAYKGCTTRMARTYVWPYHLHGSIGPSCGLADWNNGQPIVWSGTQNPHMLRADLAELVQVDPDEVEVRRYQAAGCYGRNCADDVCADALLMARAVGQPVRVQLTRAQEHLWEPKGAAQLMEVTGGLNAAQDISAYALDTWYPSNRAPNLGLLLTGRISPDPRPSDMGDRTTIPPYRIPNRKITVHDMAPIVRAAWMRGVSALPNTFAHESFVDELAHAVGEDPLEFRLRHVDDPRTQELIKKTAEAAGWMRGGGPRLRREGRMAFGRGFAFATYVHGSWPGVAAAAAAWVCDVAVDTESGEVTLTKVTVGQDQGLVINPDGVRQQIEGNVIQTASRTLVEEVAVDTITAAPRSWADYPIQTFDQLPEIRTLLMDRPNDPALGVGESAAVPAAAAIANAIFDATGVRLREVPFTPEKMRAALGAAAPDRTPASPLRAPVRRMVKRVAALAGSVAGLAMVGALALPVARAIPPQQAPGAGAFSREVLMRGAEVFAAGDCAVCHTADGGIKNAGGRAIETPFGTVYSTNLTPDPETGLGRWSFQAFDRAMRRGISRDGHNLYPAFPYTAFATLTDADMFALYAHLQTLEPVRQETPQARMLGPVALRPVNAVWNALFHTAKPFVADPAQSDIWNRGKYLVEGAGHCSACHSPRTLLGAEKTGPLALSGGMVDGWYAPALAGVASATRGWDEDQFFAYLSRGHAPGLASAAGPMAPVVEEMSTLPQSDLRAMATYLGSLQPTDVVTRTPVAEAQIAPGPVSRLFRSACGSCHEPGGVAMLTAAQLPLGTSAAVRAPSPEAVKTVIRAGINAPITADLRDMPAFANELSEGQIDALAHYLRARFAPDLPSWSGG